LFGAKTKGGINFALPQVLKTSFMILFMFYIWPDTMLLSGFHFHLMESPFTVLEQHDGE